MVTMTMIQRTVRHNHLVLVNKAGETIQLQVATLTVAVPICDGLQICNVTMPIRSS